MLNSAPKDDQPYRSFNAEHLDFLVPIRKPGETIHISGKMKTFNRVPCHGLSSDRELLHWSKSSSLKAFIFIILISSINGQLNSVVNPLPACRPTTQGEVNSFTCVGETVIGVPDYLPQNITNLHVSGSSMGILPRRAFASYPSLEEMYLRNLSELTTIEPGAFDGLASLRILFITDCMRLEAIGPGVFGMFHSLNTLRIFKTALRSVPDFSRFETRSHNNEMYEIDLSFNKIEYIRKGQFKRIKTYILGVESNHLTTIEDRAFSGAFIERLICKNNYDLSFLGDYAFHGIQGFQFLDLSHSKISYLPTEGLINIKELVIEDTSTLKQFPSVFKFSKITTAKLTYPHHCCAFRHAGKHRETYTTELPDKITTCTEPSKSTSTMITQRASFSVESTQSTRADRSVRQYLVSPLETMVYLGFRFTDGDEILDSGFNNFVTPPVRSTPIAPGKSEKGNKWHEEPKAPNETIHFSRGNYSLLKDYSEVVCTPRPNAFNPCEDVMGYEWLRVFVWVVLLAALCGNLVVIIVLLTARSKLTVQRFLMCNLSFADLMMGLYLLLIASVDAHSLGEYFTHAVSWQNDGGCQVAGFLTVFASELSVFVLTIITIERWYAISQAIHVNKRLRMKQATILMLAGWIYALAMAIFPLCGVSGYGAVSMCLPMEARDALDTLYIIALLLFNGVAFTAICGCYISMFLQVRASENTARSNDATIAKRMAILVGTNFICWAPIAFFGLTASFGMPLIDITKSKILLVFFYPFNSCANPFLYAILTKQFRRDVFILLGRHGICTTRANKYKGNSVNWSYCKHNGLYVNAGRNFATETSQTGDYRRHSRALSVTGSTQKFTPCESSSNESPDSQNPRLKQKKKSSPSLSDTSERHESRKERKLSTVIETSHTSEVVSDDGSCRISQHSSDERVLKGRDSLRDLFESNPHGRACSTSEYVVLFKSSISSPGAAHYPTYASLSTRQTENLSTSPTPSQIRISPKQQQLNWTNQEKVHRSDGFERQTSFDTILSTHTLSSLISDSTSSRIDSELERKHSQNSYQTLSSVDGQLEVCNNEAILGATRTPTFQNKTEILQPMSSLQDASVFICMPTGNEKEWCVRLQPAGTFGPKPQCTNKFETDCYKNKKDSTWEHSSIETRGGIGNFANFEAPMCEERLISDWKRNDKDEDNTEEANFVTSSFLT